NGGFFSATDADSEGEEGTFFVWSIDEIKTVLNKDEFKHFNQWFDLSSHTDFEGNHVIRFKDINDVNVDDYKQIDGLLAKLYNVR
ncbi:MAG TPA: thioredoxin domain-containing protein, partial [Gammaproteobacteria bacterium]|nr:thioredoxin domain-containing protein [Gammaproteobacteria bacterium]